MSDCLTLKKSNCKNCYKCIRHCPVKSIRFSGNQAHIISNECILCGQCFVVCPQNAKQIVDETEKAKVLIQSGDPVYVSIAPSFIANYNGVSIDAMRKALKQLGFADAEETAVGASIVKTEYEKMIEDGTADIIISSCCHSINLLIQKFFPAELPYLADVLSPMQAHCADLKRRYPNAKTVFIGPCTAKKMEVQKPEVRPYVDAAMTFEELQALFDSRDIDITTLPEGVLDNASYFGRIFARCGGLADAVAEGLHEQGLDGDFDLKAISCDGIEACRTALMKKSRGVLDANFIEGMACTGGCIGGAGCLTHGEKNKAEVDKYGREALEKNISDAVSQLQ